MGEKKKESWFSKYSFEILVFIIGIVISIIGGYFVELEIGIIILIMTIFVDIIKLSIKFALEEFKEDILQSLFGFLKQNNFGIEECYLKISDVWKEEAKSKINDFRYELEKMANGNKTLFDIGGLNYQAKLISNTKKELLAIHLGLNEKTMVRWDLERTDTDFYKQIVEASQSIPADVIKKRIFVLDDDCISKNFDLKQKLDRILKDQKNKLGFTVKIIYKSTLQKNDFPFPEDLIISDQMEVITFNLRGVKQEINVSINPAEVDKKLRDFKKYWEFAKDYNG